MIEKNLCRCPSLPSTGLGPGPEVLMIFLNQPLISSIQFLPR